MLETKEGLKKKKKKKTKQTNEYVKKTEELIKELQMAKTGTIWAIQ